GARIPRTIRSGLGEVSIHASTSRRPATLWRCDRKLPSIDLRLSAIRLAPRNRATKRRNASLHSGASPRGIRSRLPSERRRRFVQFPICLQGNCSGKIGSKILPREPARWPANLEEKIETPTPPRPLICSIETLSFGHRL